MLNQVKAYIMFIGLCMFCIGSLAIKTSDGFSANTQFTLSFQPRYFKINNVSESSQIDIKVTIQDGGDYINGGDGLIKIYRIDNGIESYCDGWDITFTQDSGYVIGHKTANGNIPQSVAGTHYYRAKFCRRNDTDTDWEEIMSIPQAELYIVNGTISDPTGNNKYTFSTATTGELIIPCSGTIWPTNIGDTIATHARWRMFNGDGTSGTEFAPSNTNRKWNGDLIGYGTGRTTNISITGMPANNSDFGRKTAEFYLLDPDNTSRRVFDIYEAPVNVYFSKNAKNHPGSKTDWPNWMYYWLQTVTPLGSGATFAYGTYSFYTPGTTLITLSDGDSESYNAPYGTNNPLVGINNFTWTVIHESQHFKDFSDLWWNNYTTWTNAMGKDGQNDDKDSDSIPNHMEDINWNQIYDTGDLYDWQVFNTPTIGRSKLIDNDDEDWNCKRHTNESGNNSLDWANPGHNY